MNRQGGKKDENGKIKKDNQKYGVIITSYVESPTTCRSSKEHKVMKQVKPNPYLKIHQATTSCDRRAKLLVFARDMRTTASTLPELRKDTSIKPNKASFIFLCIQYYAMYLSLSRKIGFHHSI